jgi:Tfp pilus assembly protein PilX
MIRFGAGSLPRGHAGTALITALVFLLILTLLGTFGMNLSRLEDRMAGNARFQALALGNAEFVLAVAEADIRSQTGNPFSPDRPGDQYYPQDTLDFDTATTGIQQPADRLWSFASAHVSLPDVDGDGSDSDGDGNADNGTGQYIIQDAGLELAFTEHTAHRVAPAALVNSTVQVFLVTARSRTSGGAQRTVQSVFVRAPLPATQSTGTGQAPHNAETHDATASGPNPAYGRHSWIDLRQ